jgi:hypothetical protein
MDYLCGLLRVYVGFKLPELAATDLCQSHPGA